MNDSSPEKIRATIAAASASPTSSGDARPNPESVERITPVSATRPNWPFWVVLAVVMIIFGNWLMPRLSVAFDWIATFKLQLVLIALVMTAILFWNGRRVAAAVSLALIALPLASLLTLYMPVSQPESVTRNIRLMTFNVLESSDRYQETLDMIRDEDPDVIGLVEFDNLWVEAFKGELNEYPHRVGPFLGNIIYSKLPLDRLISQRDINPPRAIPGMFVTFRVDDQPVYFILVHTSSPRSSSEMVERDSQINGIQRKTLYASSFRHVVVAGDFNATTDSRSLQSMIETAGLRDSRRGFGLQHSWPTWFWPVSICIDHCFVSEGVVIESRRRGANVGSDHLPVIIDMAFARHRRNRGD